MSNHIKGQSTGPKTVDGKAASSQNARKDSIFVQGYLPWENIDEKQQQFVAMAKQWGTKDPSRQMLLRTIEQCQLSIERMMYIERKKSKASCNRPRSLINFVSDLAFLKKLPMHCLIGFSWKRVIQKSSVQ